MIPGAELQQLRREYRRDTGQDLEPAYLGDENGEIYDINQDGYVWVRFLAAGGNFSKAISVRLRAVVPINSEDSQTPVMVGYDHQGKLAVLDIDFDGMLARNQSPYLSNPADVNLYGFTAPSQFMPLYSHATSTPSTASTDVAVWGIVYIYGDTVHVFYGERVALSSYIPSAGQQRLACLFLKADDTIEVTVSTIKAEAEPIGIVDLQECLDGATPGSLPLWAWLLKDAATTLTDADRYQDLRQLINMSFSMPSGFFDNLVVNNAGEPVYNNGGAPIWANNL